MADDDTELLPPPSLVSPPREKRTNGEGGMRPLTISIPSGNDANYEASPPSSPTGTISVPNSCPTSPNSHRIFNPYSHYRPVTQHTPTIAQVELEETKPDLNLLTHNAVVYPTEDGGLSTVPVDPSPPIQVECLPPSGIYFNSEILVRLYQRNPSFISSVCLVLMFTLCSLPG